MSTVLWAVMADMLLGEPPTSIHPTVHMGTFIKKCRPRIKRRPVTEFVHGAGIVAGGMVGSALFGILAERLVSEMPMGFGSISKSMMRGAALKPAMALRSLLAAARSIEHALSRNDLDEARRLLAWHLVSRDTTTLTEAEVIGATIESIAENLSDSFIAPLLMYRLGGLPAAYAYRFVNTADAMLGYRTPELEWLGKCSARLDDLLNIVSARITALCIALAAPVGGGRTNRALRIAQHDARRTLSPNAGWPMAAMAGAIDCRLTKRGHYVLHGKGNEPTVDTLRRARHIVTAAAAIGAWALR